MTFTVHALKKENSYALVTLSSDYNISEDKMARVYVNGSFYYEWKQDQLLFDSNLHDVIFLE